MATYSASVRRGLPRVPGGGAWPEVEGSAAVLTPTTAGPELGEIAAPAAAEHTLPIPPAITTTATLATTTAGSVRSAGPGGPVRRGLPRTPGGESWPPVELAATVAMSAAPTQTAVPAAGGAPAAAAPADIEPVAIETAQASAAPESVLATPPAFSAPVSHANEEPTQKPGTGPSAATSAGSAASAAPESAPAVRTFRGRPLSWWTTRSLGLAAAAVAAAGIFVLAARGVTTLPGVPEFLTRYPGEYHPAVTTEDGFPAWARWTHYLNFFFMVLIVRTGLLVRQQQQPPAFVTPTRGGRKVSIYLWLHLSLDVLWLLNGVVFVALLFITGHWARIVPTSIEVFPNAVSALLQYLTLEWPTENGWVNYNSLQQLMYFAIVFLAAPLAAITGVRMSEWWPKNRPGLNRVYPMEVARAIHFPVMLFFALFTIVHVFLVFATGALRNLNHMFAGQDTVSWVGFWWFAAGLLVSIAAVVAARPLVLAPIAGLTGKVSNR